MQFLSDNAAAVHPAVWAAMQAADAPQPPYDNDTLSQSLDAAFSAMFGRACVALWVASGTAANCLALQALVPPHGAVVCHAEAHIEQDEGGAPGFFTHGAKLMLAGGDHAKLTPETIEAVLGPIRRDVHRVWPTAVSITQASEAGCVYMPDELAAIGEMVRARGLRLHMDGARFANAVAYLGCSPAEAALGVDALSFGFVKNGGLNAEALVLFDPALADQVRAGRKRAGHLQSKGRFMAAQLLAMLKDDVWLANARAANGAAQQIAQGAAGRLLYPTQANEVFVRLSAAERDRLRAAGFGFYDWGAEGARFVTAWNTSGEDAEALANALAQL